MQYKKILPNPNISQYVHSFTIIDINQSEASTKRFRFAVDASPSIIFFENTNSFLTTNNQKMPSVILHGLSTIPFIEQIKYTGKIISVNLKPNAIKYFFDVNVKELINNTLNFDLVSNINLSEKLLNTQSTEKRIEIISNFLSKNIIKKQKIEKTTYALKLLQSEDNEISLQKIQNELNLSERSLERIFIENIGISPKLFSRINRFQKSLKSLRNMQSLKFVDIAFNNYYSDQSHFIREFKEFSGMTPLQYLNRSKEMQDNLIDIIY